MLKCIIGFRRTSKTDISMIILKKPISKEELAELAENYYGDMIKGVVDVDR